MTRGVVAPNFHLRVSLLIVYFLGTWPPRAGIYRLLYLLYTVCSFIFILGILLAAEIANMLVNLTDMSKVVAGATLLMTNCTHASKVKIYRGPILATFMYLHYNLFSFWNEYFEEQHRKFDTDTDSSSVEVIVLLRRQRRIQALLDTANSPTFHRYDEAHQDLLMSYSRKGFFHHMAYQSFGAVAVFCWGFTPVADLLAGRSRRLPMEGWYPYNTTVTPAFEITAGHQGISIVLACFHNVAMDTIMTGLIAVACCQLAILERKIIAIDNEKSIYETQNKDRSIEEKALCYQQLKRCVMHNNMIFHFTREIQDIFGTVIFFQFLSNCIIICLIAFNVSQMKIYIPAVLIGMLTYLCCMTYQIFIFCWHGNELHLHSIRMVTAAYSSNWFSGTEGFKRSLRIMMTRAHRPFILSAGNIMLLSLDTFVEIMRTSYSIFTVLQGSAA